LAPALVKDLRFEPLWLLCMWWWKQEIARNI
jgi:hypothetical protein